MQGSPDSSRTATGSSATTSGRMGIPTKVMLHKKAAKSLAHLAVVQELYAHSGEHVAVLDHSSRNWVEALIGCKWVLILDVTMSDMALFNMP